MFNSSILKRHTAIILAVLVSMPMPARFVNREKALETAQSFFAAGTRGQVSDSGLEIVWPGASMTRTVTDTPSYYIINRTDGKGFVIVSAESSTPDILAYSNENAFSLELLDKAPALFLDTYEKSIAMIRQGVPAMAAPDGQYIEKVLKTACWQQDGNFFNSTYAPEIDGRKCVSGCVATAMSIMMKYHSWPPVSTGYHEYQCSGLGTVSFDYDSVSYSWDDLTDNISGWASDEVSKIQKACGVSVNMKYGIHESSSSLSLVATSMPKYFQYEIPYRITRDSYEKDEWESVLMNEIDEGRPAFIGGYRGNTGHSFILDGYNSEGMFHFNLGWGGYNNGFYRLELVAGEYSVEEAVVGVMPRDIDEKLDVSPLTYSSIAVSPDGNISDRTVFNVSIMNLTNIDNVAATCRIRLDVYDQSYRYKFTVQESQYGDIVIPCTYGIDNLSFSHAMLPSGCTVDETDRLALSTSTDGGKTWVPIASRHYTFPLYTLGGHERDAFIFSPLSFFGQDPQISVPSVITVGEKFSVSVPMTVNQAAETFSGKYGIGICDTSEMKVKYVLAYKTESDLPQNYGLMPVFDNLTISPSQASGLGPKDAIAMVTCSKKDSEYRIVCDMNLNPVVIGLQSLLGIDLSVPAPVQDNGDSYWTIDGKKSDVRPQGLYIMQSHGSTSKFY